MADGCGAGAKVTCGGMGWGPRGSPESSVPACKRPNDLQASFVPLPTAQCPLPGPRSPNPMNWAQLWQAFVAADADSGARRKQDALHCIAAPVTPSQH
jgi:hypothetical protein